MLTYFLVNLTWVFFRARDFAQAWSMIRAMLGFGVEGTELALSTYLVALVTTVTAGMLLVHGFMRNRRLEEVVAKTPWWLVGSVWAAMLVLILITQGSGDAFIYFQF